MTANTTPNLVAETIRRYLRQLAPHIAEREAALLLVQAASEIERLAAIRAETRATLLSGVSDLHGLIGALTHKQQCDADGIYCQVSRQAVDEALGVLQAICALPDAKGQTKAVEHHAHPAGGYWLIYFHDADRRPEIFTEERPARQRWGQISGSWNADLFQRVERNYQDEPAGTASSQPTEEQIIQGGVDFIMGPGDDEGTRMVRAGTAPGREEPQSLLRPTTPALSRAAERGWQKRLRNQYGPRQAASLRGDKEGVAAADLWIGIIAKECVHEILRDYDALAKELERVRGERDEAKRCEDVVMSAIGKFEAQSKGLGMINKALIKQLEQAEQRATTAEASGKQMREWLKEAYACIREAADKILNKSLFGDWHNKHAAPIARSRDE